MSRPVFIEPVINREMGDCTLTCLVMWTGKPYQDVIAVCPVGAHKKGLWNYQIVEAAGRLGSTLITKRHYNIHEDDGILMLHPDPAKGRPPHAVVLVNSAVLDPYNGRLWLDVDTYLQVERYKAGVLLIEIEDK